MKIPKQIWTVIIVIVLVVAGFLVYTYFFTGKTEDVLATTEVASGAGVDQELLALLLELRSIELDETIFDDEKFKSLVDFSQELILEPVGRTNPFAPLGR